MLARKVNLTRSKGEMYISVIIAVGLLLILSQAIMSLVFAAYDYVSFSRARTTARHIAQERIEIIRSMHYDNIGTIGGIPNGTIPQQDTITRNGQAYTVTTNIGYVDDEFDQTAPNDTVPNDYKRVRVDISWGGVATASGMVTLVTDISPNGIENLEGGGVISILVLDAHGLPVEQAEVHITATSLNPPVDTVELTNSNGRVILPGAQTCNACYRVSVTKEGYSTERTYSTSEVANPLKPDMTIIENQVTEFSFAIDRLSTVNIATVSDAENNFSPLGNQTINVRSTKYVGTTELDEKVYKYDEDITTDATGNVTLENMEWDAYTVLPVESNNRIISSNNPLLPLVLNPNTSIDLTLGLTPTPQRSIMVTVLGPTGTQQSDITVTLSDDNTYQNSLITGGSDQPNFGQVFFNELEAAQYTIEATGAGFVTTQKSVPITGNQVETISIFQE